MTNIDILNNEKMEFQKQLDRSAILLNQWYQLRCDYETAKKKLTNRLQDMKIEIEALEQHAKGLELLINKLGTDEAQLPEQNGSD